MLKALRLLKVVQQGHCDTCAINKTRLPPRPEGKTTRPTREARVQKLTIDVWGRVEEQSIFHHYHYLLMGATEVGFILRCGLVSGVNRYSEAHGCSNSLEAVQL